MEIKTLREAIIWLQAENGGEINQPATVGQLLKIAKMVEKELTPKQ